jgi:hypothetical protein
VSTYDERVTASGRVAARAEAILAGQLAQQGRLPNNYTEAEYHAALEAAQAELAPKPRHRPSTSTRCGAPAAPRRRSGVSSTATSLRRASRSTTSTDASDYLARYTAAAERADPASAVVRTFAGCRRR